MGKRKKPYKCGLCGCNLSPGRGGGGRNDTYETDDGKYYYYCWRCKVEYIRKFQVKR